MLKVIIADDEVRVCRLVQMLADWEQLGMEVSGTAANGLEALELVESLNPDILITDIRMPGCDGLELIKRVRKICPNIEIIILSGYAQFDYAQTAIDYNVGGYLLKPIKKDALMNTLDKMRDRCLSRAYYAKTILNLEQDHEKNRYMLRERLIDDLLEGRSGELTNQRLIDQYGFIADDGSFQIFILKMDCDPEQFNSIPIDLIHKKAEEICESTIFPLCISGVMRFQRSFAYGLIHFNSDKQNEIRFALREYMNQMQAQRYFFGSAKFSLAISRPIDDVQKLPDSICEAKNILSQRLIDGNGRMLEWSLLTPSGIDMQKVLGVYNRSISYAIDSLISDESDKSVNELRETVEQEKNILGYELLDIVLGAYKMFSLKINMDKHIELVSDFERCCELCSNTVQLFDYLKKFQENQIKLRRQHSENMAIRPIRQAKRYIQQNFSKNIALEDVCTDIGFSVSYFSAMFKKETGEGFSKYLTRVRMTEAKNLLQETNIPVSQICEQVGYSDLKHFTNTFKKATGLNPGQYRKLYG